LGKGKKTGGRNFEPGHPPMGGRPKLAPEVKEARKVTSAEVGLILSRISKYSHKELLDYIDRTLNKAEGTVMEVLICRVLDKGVKKGDLAAVNFLLDRLIGRVPQPVETTDQGFVIRIEDYVSKKE
jgi:hypothetical protein